jgi:hypothetical protein
VTVTQFRNHLRNSAARKAAKLTPMKRRIGVSACGRKGVSPDAAIIDEAVDALDPGPLQCDFADVHAYGRRRELLLD